MGEGRGHFKNRLTTPVFLFFQESRILNGIEEWNRGGSGVEKDLGRARVRLVAVGAGARVDLRTSQ